MALFGRADARAFLLLLHVGLAHRHAMHRKREPARGGEGLGAFVSAGPAATSLSVTSLRKSSAARACMRAGISSEKNSSKRSGMGCYVLSIRNVPLPPSERWGGVRGGGR